MTGMCDEVGTGGDVAVAATIVAAHDGCPDCAAGRCETGTWAAQALAAWRVKRDAARQ